MLKNRLSLSIPLMLSLLLTTACANHYRKRDDEAAKKVKSAAVIAFIVKEPASNKLSMDLSGGGTSAQLGGSSFYQNSPDTDNFYKEFAGTVSQKIGWSVKPLSAVASNPVYTDWRKKMMAPVQVMYLPKAGENWSMAKDIMVPKAAEMLGRNERNQLIAALGVDALIISEVRVDVKGGFSIGSLGPRRPQAHFDMTIYERDNDKPIWLEGATGPKSEESLGWIGFIDEDRLRDLSRESAQKAFLKINSEIN